MVWLTDLGLIELFSTHFLASFLELLLGVVTHSTGLSVTMPLALGQVLLPSPQGNTFRLGQPLHLASVIHWIQVVLSPDTPGTYIHSKLQQSHGIQSMVQSAFINTSFSPGPSSKEVLSQFQASLGCSGERGSLLSHAAARVCGRRDERKGRHLLPKLSPRLGLCELLGILMDLIPIYFLTCK